MSSEVSVQSLAPVMLSLRGGVAASDEGLCYTLHCVSLYKLADGTDPSFTWVLSSPLVLSGLLSNSTAFSSQVIPALNSTKQMLLGLQPAPSLSTYKGLAASRDTKAV